MPANAKIRIEALLGWKWTRLQRNHETKFMTRRQLKLREWEGIIAVCESTVLMFSPLEILKNIHALHQTSLYKLHKNCTVNDSGSCFFVSAHVFLLPGKVFSLFVFFSRSFPCFPQLCYILSLIRILNFYFRMYPRHHSIQYVRGGKKSLWRLCQ